jgi:hypothetical protein
MSVSIYIKKTNYQHMKRISFLFLVVFIISIVISSCSDNVTYAEQLKTEKATISAYIKRENIHVISKVPTNKVWGEHDYLLTTDGLYFHLVDSGDVASGDTLELSDIVVPRYKEYKLTEASDTLSNWNTIDYPYPASFKYGDLTQSCSGFHEAAKLMKRNYSRAKIIIPSKIGFYSSDLTSATPYGYEIKIKIQK